MGVKLRDAAAFTTTLVNGHLRGVAGNNGVFAAPGTFPTQSYGSSNYFRDLVFVADGSGDTTPPTVSITQPTAGSTVSGPVTITAQLTTGSGLPLTPVYLTSVPGTGVTGSIRASATNTSPDPPEGYYLDPSAYAAPASGQWGNAARNSIPGPRQFSLDAGIGRTFLWGDRLNLDWRMNATNILVVVQGATGLVWEPWRNTYAMSYPTPPNFCLKIFGTTLNQQWNNECK